MRIELDLDYDSYNTDNPPSITLETRTRADKTMLSLTLEDRAIDIPIRDLEKALYALKY